MDERQYYYDEMQQFSGDRQGNYEDNKQTYNEKPCTYQNNQQYYEEKKCNCPNNNNHYQEIQYSLNEAYPKVSTDNKNCPNNKQDLEMLQILYCSNYGEVTAILQYLQQHLVFDCKYEEVANIIKHIAGVEMHHMELIGEAIVTLGGSAKYINIQEHRYWNGGMVSYSCNLCKELMGNLKSETEAYKTYLNFAERTKNYSLKALYKRIAMDEKLHIDIFTQLINNYCR